MNRDQQHVTVWLVLACSLILLSACGAEESEWESEAPTATRPPAVTTVATAPPAPQPPPTSGEVDKWALWTTGTQLRGANIYQRRVYPELDGSEFMGPGPVGPPYIQADFDRLAAMGANTVNISHPGLFSETPPYALDEDIQHNLDGLLAMIAQADMFAVISFRTGPGRAEFSVCCFEEAGDWFDESYLNDQVWREQAAQDSWVEMWRYTAERYRDAPIVVGYDLMVEPNANEVWMDVWEPEDFHAEYGGTLYDWNGLHPRISAAIREVDPDTPILTGGMGYSAIEWLPYLQPTGDPRTVYVAHQYAPYQYTHQWWEDLAFAYPGALDTDWDGTQDVFDKAWLDDLLATMDSFAVTHGVPVAVNEFGVIRWVPAAAEFMDDQMGLFEQRGMNYVLWSWESSWPPIQDEIDAFNFRHGPDPDTHADVESSPLQDVITRYWGRNIVRPSNAVPGGATGADVAPGDPQLAASGGHSPAGVRLADVSHWLYLIDVNLEMETVEQIAASEYDMVVLDFIPSEENNTEYPMADVVARLHAAPHPKLAIAYVDIGEAEEYRTYWQEDWGVGNPEWIAGDDPDGWEGNFPVAYWHDEWREIWLGEGGYLQAIIDAGFDGVYLDWVEAYSDENVISVAGRDGVEPTQEMIKWVADIAGFTRARRPGFIVIGQNAAELAEDDDYLAVIDAIAQEQVWFDGGADNDPPGDCPLPRTDDEVDTDAYRGSLSRACRHYLDRDPNSTLHVSSEEYLRYLALAQRRGVLIFTVDYALEPENAAWVYETSRALGFVPFVSNRALDRYVEPVP